MKFTGYPGRFDMLKTGYEAKSQILNLISGRTLTLISGLLPDCLYLFFRVKKFKTSALDTPPAIYFTHLFPKRIQLVVKQGRKKSKDEQKKQKKCNYELLL